MRKRTVLSCAVSREVSAAVPRGRRGVPVAARAESPAQRRVLAASRVDGFVCSDAKPRTGHRPHGIDRLG